MRYPHKDSQTVIIWLRAVRLRPKGYRLTHENVTRACQRLLEFAAANCDPSFPTYFTADGSEDLADMIEHVAGMYSMDPRCTVDWIGIGASLKRTMRERLGEMKGAH